MDMREACAREAETWGPNGALIAAKIRALPPVPPRPMEEAPEDESVILVTAGGWIGEAINIPDEPTPGRCTWVWACGEPVGNDFRMLGWYPMPPHPCPALDNPQYRAKQEH